MGEFAKMMLQLFVVGEGRNAAHSWTYQHASPNVPQIAVVVSCLAAKHTSVHCQAGLCATLVPA